MVYYLATFNDDLTTYDNLDDVIRLDTSKYTNGTTVIVPGQGFFVWFIDKKNVPPSMKDNFVYPTTYGYGWIQDFNGFLVGDDGIIDRSHLPSALVYSGWFGPKGAQNFSGAIGHPNVTSSFPGMLPSDLVFLSPTSTPTAQGVRTQPLLIEPQTDQLLVEFNGSPTGATTYKIISFSGLS